MRVKMTPLPAFALNAVTAWARSNLSPGANVLSDGLSSFSAVIDTVCAHSYTVVAGYRSRDLPQFLWINTVIGNLKTARRCPLSSTPGARHSAQS